MDQSEETRAVHNEYWRRLKSGDMESMQAMLSDDFRSWSPGRGWMGKTETAEFTEFFRTLLVDGWFQFEEPIVTVEGDRVCAATSSYAKLKNGNIYNNHYHFLHVIRNGKIVESREYNDSAHVREVLKNELDAYRAAKAGAI